MAYHDDVITRILDTLKYNAAFAAKISEFRYGDNGTFQNREATAFRYPLCYVTTSSQLEIERRATGPQGNINKIPSQDILYEFWVYIAASAATPELAQRQMYDLVSDAKDILENNNQLRDPEDSTDPLAMHSDILVQRRIERYRGTMIESSVIRVRPRKIAAR